MRTDLPLSIEQHEHISRQHSNGGSHTSPPGSAAPIEAENKGNHDLLQAGTDAGSTQADDGFYAVQISDGPFSIKAQNLRSFSRPSASTVFPSKDTDSASASYIQPSEARGEDEDQRLLSSPKPFFGWQQETYNGHQGQLSRALQFCEKARRLGLSPAFSAEAGMRAMAGQHVLKGSYASSLSMSLLIVRHHMQCAICLLV